jgi:glycosyltransferase involved in cell wall biosynthesis
MQALTAMVPRNRISVCMATHNGERFIAKQIASILSQIGSDDELIISDDGSVDRTVPIISSFKDARIKVLASSRRTTIPENFENALACARGELIFLADQDDLWLPGKASTMSLLLGQYDLVVSDCAIVDEEDVVIESSFFRLHRSRGGLVRNWFRNCYVGCCMAFRRSVLTAALPFPAKVPWHDQWIGLIAEAIGRTKFFPGVLMHYRRHSGNASPTLGGRRFSLWRKVANRAHLAIELRARIAVVGRPPRRALPG